MTVPGEWRSTPGVVAPPPLGCWRGTAHSNRSVEALFAVAEEAGLGADNGISTRFENGN
jgi:hypothetical protein